MVKADMFTHNPEQSADAAVGALARRRKPEDTAEGCRSMADDDRARAAALDNVHMRFRLERSADAWAARAALLARLETGFEARAAEERASRTDPD